MHRSTMVLPRKNCKHISSRAAQSIVLQFCAISIRDILKGMYCIWTGSNESPLNDLRFFHRFAYIEFAEPSFVDAAISLNESLFRGRLLKVRTPMKQVLVKMLLTPRYKIKRSHRNGQTFLDFHNVVVEEVASVVLSVVEWYHTMATRQCMDIVVVAGTWSIGRGSWNEIINVFVILPHKQRPWQRFLLFALLDGNDVKIVHLTHVNKKSEEEDWSWSHTLLLLFTVRWIMHKASGRLVYKDYVLKALHAAFWKNTCAACDILLRQSMTKFAA